MDFDPQLAVTLIIAILGGGGIVGMAFKYLVSDKDRASTARLDGFREGRDASRSDLEELRRSLEIKISDLDTHIRQLHEALIELVPLVHPGKLEQALKILAKLGLGRIPDPMEVSTDGD